jgi:glycosyltransferase involved in cell wall biosynthesis
MKRLNLGCGAKRLDGYINIDVVPSPATDLVADIVQLPMFPDESVDEIRMDAVYEHLYRHDRTGALREWLRILRPGGRLVLNWIPDFAAAIDAYSERRPGIQRVVDELKGAGSDNVSASNARYGSEPVSVKINAVAWKPDRGSPDGLLSEPNAACPGDGGGTPTLSVVINTLNEEHNLEDCLRSLDGCADEIVVVDMRSEDRTVEIARRYTDRVLFHDRTGIVEPARQFAIDQARGEWVLLVDADERLTPDLARLVRQTIANGGAADCYRVPRRNFIAGRWMNGTGWGTDVEWQPRLFRRRAVTWPCEVHGAPTVRGRVENLSGSSDAVLLHYNYRNLREFVERLNTYTNFEAAKLLAGGETFSWPKAAQAALAEVRTRYEPHKDGVHSLVLSLCMAFYRFLSWAKLWERQGYPATELPASWVGLLAASSADAPGPQGPARLAELDRANQALHAGAWAEAADAYIGVLEREPVCAEARSGLGLALLALGDTDEGMAQLEEGVRLAPTPDVVTNLACGCIHVGRFTEAKRLLEGVLAVAPAHEAARFNLDRLREAWGALANA